MTDSHELDPVTLFIIEDDDVDAAALVRAIRKIGLRSRIERSTTAVEALHRLRTEFAESDEYPIVFLDLNMPQMRGGQFLAEIRQDPKLRSLVIFVLSTSSDPRDVEEAYLHNVAGYAVKDVSSGSLTEFVEMLDRYGRAICLPQGLGPRGD